MNWYYAENGQRLGPVSQEQLAGLVEDGTVNSGTMLWREGAASWRPACEAAPGLFGVAGEGGGSTSAGEPPERAPILDLFDDAPPPPVAAPVVAERSFFARYRWGLLLTLVVAICVSHLVFNWGRGIPFLSKNAMVIASTCFVLIGITGGAHATGVGRLLLCGLIGCWWGDLLLARGPFEAGVIAFLVGHLFFGAAFCMRGMNMRWMGISALAMVPVSGAIYWMFCMHIPPEHRILVLIYVVVISLMVATSWGSVGARRSILVPLGAVVFYLSDICVATNAFLDLSFSVSFIGAPLYFGSVVALAFVTYERPE